VKVKNHIVNDDIDQVCLILKRKILNKIYYFLLASTHSDHARKRSHRSNGDPSLSNNVDKTMSHIMANGVRSKIKNIYILLSFLFNLDI
jgi:hypothetical protein